MPVLHPECQPFVVCEVWAVAGTGWRLPIFVEWHGNMSIARVRIGAGVSLLAKQRALLRKTLDQVGQQRDDNENVWWLAPEQLALIAVKADVEDPEDVVIWSISAAGTREVKPIFDSALSNEFVEFYCRDGLINAPAPAAAAYQDFCNHGLQWMLLYQKPWDLGFAVLYPTPLRADWKQIVEQFISKKRSLKQQRHNLKSKKIILPPTKKTMAAEGSMELLLMPELLALMRGTLLRWGIEVRYRKGWHLVNMRMEKEKRIKGNQYYLYQVYETMRRLLPYHCDLFLAYVRQATCPSYHFRTTKRAQRLDFVPGQSFEWEQKYGDLLPPIAWCGDQAFYRLVKSNRSDNHREPLVAPDAEMPKVPRLRRKTEKLWDSWSDLEGPNSLAS